MNVKGCEKVDALKRKATFDIFAPCSQRVELTSLRRLIVRLNDTKQPTRTPRPFAHTPSRKEQDLGTFLGIAHGRSWTGLNALKDTAALPWSRLSQTGTTDRLRRRVWWGGQDQWREGGGDNDGEVEVVVMMVIIVMIMMKLSPFSFLLWFEIGLKLVRCHDIHRTLNNIGLLALANTPQPHPSRYLSKFPTTYLLPRNSSTSTKKHPNMMRKYVNSTNCTSPDLEQGFTLCPTS